VSLTNRYFFDWIEYVRTATLFSEKSSCIRFASEYHIQTASSKTLSDSFSPNRREKSCLSFQLMACITQRISDYPGIRICTSCDVLSAGRTDSICILGISIEHLFPDISSTLSWISRANYFNFSLNLISKSSHVWERSIFKAIDPWNSLFLYSLNINLRTDLILFSPLRIHSFCEKG
jgi:hypothetical protein